VAKYNRFCNGHIIDDQTGGSHPWRIQWYDNTNKKTELSIGYRTKELASKGYMEVQKNYKFREANAREIPDSAVKAIRSPIPTVGRFRPDDEFAAAAANRNRLRGDTQVSSLTFDQKWKEGIRKWLPEDAR